MRYQWQECWQQYKTVKETPNHHQWYRFHKYQWNVILKISRKRNSLIERAGSKFPTMHLIYTLNKQLIYPQKPSLIETESGGIMLTYWSGTWRVSVGFLFLNDDMILYWISHIIKPVKRLVVLCRPPYWFHLGTSAKLHSPMCTLSVPCCSPAETSLLLFLWSFSSLRAVTYNNDLKSDLQIFTLHTAAPPSRILRYHLKGRREWERAKTDPGNCWAHTEPQIY